jgi:hypothetical protein
MSSMDLLLDLGHLSLQVALLGQVVVPHLAHVFIEFVDQRNSSWDLQLRHSYIEPFEYLGLRCCPTTLLSL